MMALIRDDWWGSKPLAFLDNGPMQYLRQVLILRVVLSPYERRNLVSALEDGMPVFRRVKGEDLRKMDMNWADAQHIHRQ